MLIIALHQFNTKEPNQPYAVSKKYLETVFSILESNLCSPLNDLNLSSPLKNTWALSVDDGYATDLMLWEFCKSFKIPLTNFINTANLGKKGFISQNELKDLVQDGMGIGTHAHNHIDLTMLNSSEIQREITISKSTLEDLTGLGVTKLAYPWGRNNFIVRKIAKSTGIDFAFATTARNYTAIGTRYCIPRYALTENAPIQPKHYRALSYPESLSREPLKMAYTLKRRIFEKK